jgi:long-chain acyl-CoA synthetase
VNLARIITESADAHPEGPALLVEGETTTHAELAQRADAGAALLRARGVTAGDRVATLLPNGVAAVAALLGIWRLGAIAVPLNVLLARPEIETRLDRAQVSVVLAGEDELPPCSAGGEIVAREPSDPAAILFTSGTSGAPKGAVLTHGSLWAAAAGAGAAMAFGPEDVVLGAAPFSHVLGLSTGIVSTLAHGGAIAVERRFEAPATLERMRRTGTTILLGVPTMCIALCEAARGLAPDALPPLRVAHVGGAAVPDEVADAVERTFGADLVEGYGLTEMSGIATTYGRGDHRRRGSVGKPLPGTEIAIAGADEAGRGEVLFRGPSVVAGYWQDEVATAEAISADGWLATGDIGYLDENGYLFLVDRKKEVVIRGGYNVYPREVEEVLYAHEDVLEAAVLGVPHASLGEEVAAVVVLRAGATPNVEELRAWVKERVAAYKYPRVIAFADELPKGPSGKILKRAIDRDTLLS